MPTTAARTALIEPFYVMELVKEAQELAAAGRSVIHLSIGEPDFTAPEPVRRAAIETIERGETQYTAALGLPALRNCISAWYASRFNCDDDRGRYADNSRRTCSHHFSCPNGSETYRHNCSVD